MLNDNHLHWKRNLFLMWYSQILVWAGFAAVMPFIPLFMKEKLIFIEILCQDLIKNMKIHMKNEEKTKGIGYWFSESHGNKNHGKTALKRKITFLRQELLNLERMLDE